MKKQPQLLVEEPLLLEEALEQGPPAFHYYMQPITSTAYYDYFDSFLLGLKLDTFFQGSDACINDLVYSIDDAAYLYNNVSDFTLKNWIGPVFNVSHMVAGNISSALVDCDTMTNNAITAFLAYYKAFTTPINFFESFLFNMMGNALKYKSIFTQITADQQTQNYADIANQWGRMVRITLDFTPMQGDSPKEKLVDLEALLAEHFFSDTMDNESIEGSEAYDDEFKSIDAIHKTFNSIMSFLKIDETLVMPDMLLALETVNDLIFDMGTSMKIPTFTNT